MRDDGAGSLRQCEPALISLAQFQEKSCVHSALPMDEISTKLMSATVFIGQVG